MRMPDKDRSRAVLIGAGAYTSPELPDVPAVYHNVRDLKRELTRTGRGAFHPEHCVEITDPPDHASLGRQLLHVARQAEDVFLVYFAGHGLLGERGRELYLALGDTDPDALIFTAMPFEGMRAAFLSSPAKTRVLMLDCCFSGRAIGGHLADDMSAVLGQIETEGTYILTSAAANQPALTGDGTRHTVFTGELISQLRGSTSGLTLGELYERLRRSLAARGLPRPQQLGTDTAQTLLLAAGGEAAADEDEGPWPPPPVGKAEEARRLAEAGDHETAVRLYREVLPTLPGREVRAAYASALRGLARSLGDQLREEEAAEAGREAATEYRRLAREDPGRYRPALGEALFDLSTSLRVLRRFETACEALEEAVSLFRALYAEDPSTHRRGLLAKALEALGTTLRRVGRTAQATSLLQEAVRLYRILDEEAPELYREELADTLMILGDSLSELERHGEATEEHAEAARLYGVLSPKDSAAYRPRLARALTLLGGYLSVRDRHDEARDAYTRAVVVYRQLSGEDEAAYRPRLADALGGLAGALNHLGQHREAWRVDKEAMRLRFVKNPS
jgi:uncharacterized caspase-like protein